jgi:hypothetical protein
VTQKEQFIINYLTAHNGMAYYIDIRDKLSLEFDTADDFDNTIDQLVEKKWIYENEAGDTLFRLKLNINNKTI